MPPKTSRVVELLPRLPPAKRARHLADEEEHRRRVLPAVCTPTAACVAPGPRVTRQMPGPPGELAVRLGRVRRALLVPARDQPDRGVVERVEHRQVALARQAEREVGAVQLELVDEDPAAGSHSASGSSSRTVARWSFGFSSSAGSR